ncbi:MAG: hypothetical protein HKM24_08020 [Gammaproteobacteria bacterium]|nr:hypothetical protein [Gammaproteobacteria bacterium]
MSKFTFRRAAIAASVFFVLSACGGSGGNLTAVVDPGDNGKIDPVAGQVSGIVVDGVVVIAVVSFYTWNDSIRGLLLTAT